MVAKLVSVAEMQRIEKEADNAGLTYAMMMENAGVGLAEVIDETYGYLADEGIVGLIGSGNNGGDALVALSKLATAGWPAYAYLVRPRDPADRLMKRFLDAGGIIYENAQDTQLGQLKTLIEDNAIILDGVLGTGFRLPLKREIAEIFEFIHQLTVELKEALVIIAVDCPSGIDCDSGEADPAVLPADLTVTMAAIKQGLFRQPANRLIGELTIVSIGLPSDERELPAWTEVRTIVPDAEWVKSVMPRRPIDAHKGTFGTALVIAGSLNYTGAAWLAGQAAYRIGAGLVTLAVPEPLHAALAGQFPEATWLLLPEIDGCIAQDADEVIADHLNRASAALIGPGFGLHKESGEFIRRLITKKTHLQPGFLESADEQPNPSSQSLPPLVVDADGLKLLAQIPQWDKLLPKNSILTPHPGEMSILCGLSRDEIQANRREIAQRFSKEWGQIVILKGAFTVIAAPDGETAVIPIATPALARAGTGDVLAGLICGLLAQGVPAYPAAVASAWIHAQAGWRAAEQLGNSASVLAGDVLRGVIDVLSLDLV